MYYSIAADFRIAINDLFKIIKGLFLGQSSLGGYKFGKITTVAKLGDDVSIIFCRINVVYLNDVPCIFESFKHFYL